MKQNANKWQVIVFDLDDTLYPESSYVLSGFRAVANWAQDNLAIPADQGYVELRTLYENGVRGDTFNKWLATHELSFDLTSKLVQVYRYHTPVIHPFEEIEPVLQALCTRYRLGLVSDGYLNVQQAKWSALNLGHYFDAVVFSDQWGRAAWKPSVIPFEAVLTQLNMKGSDAVYVADNATKDFIGARSLGMSTIWIRRADGEYSSVEPPTPAHNADTSIQRLDCLIALLEGVKTL